MSEQTLHARHVGDAGERIVFLHGLFGQGKNFTSAAKDLTPAFQSLLVDLPNHGQSEWTDSSDYVGLADAVAAFVRADFAAEGPVHVVGHSMGGKVAMVLALRHPDLVDRLVVVDISPTESPDSTDFEHLLGSLADLDLSAIDSRGEADSRLAARIDDPRVRGFLLQNLRRGDDGRYTWQANLDLLRRELGVIGGFPELRSTFEGPVLWLAGERSPYVQDANEATMRRLFPNTRHTVVKDAGHWVHADEPEAFVSALRVFLSA